MTINTYLSTTEYKITKLTSKQNRNRLTDTESILMIAKWEKCWGVGEKGEGINNYKLQNSHGDVKYRLGSRVNNILITMYGVRRV